MVAGLDLIRRHDGTPSDVLTIPLLTTSTGEKMGKTHNGAAWLAPDKMTPFDMYQYWYNVDDRDVGRFLKLFTFLPLGEIDRLMEDPDGIRFAKQNLAFEATTVIHGLEPAKEANRVARAIRIGAICASYPKFNLSTELPLASILHKAGMVSSASEGRRMIANKGIQLDNVLVQDEAIKIDPAQITPPLYVRIGKNKILAITTSMP